MIIQEKNSKGQDVGFHNTEDGCYNTTRDFKKNQIFIHPKYKHAVAVDSDIIVNCVKIAYAHKFTPRTYRIRFLIKNFEDEDFVAEITLQDFLEKSEEFSYDKRGEKGESYTGYGKQRRLSIGEMIRVYKGQQILAEGIV